MHNYLMFALFLAIIRPSAVTAADAPKINQRPLIEFLTMGNASKVIIAEKIEPYFALMTKLDLSAKVPKPLVGDSTKQWRAAGKKQYQAAMRDFTDAEKKAITTSLDFIHPVLVKHYPLLARTPWRLIKKSDTLESGAHFTREDCIVLSERFVIAAAKNFTLMSDEKLTREKFIAKTAWLLLHEQSHVHQRLYPERFAKLYTEHWKIIRAEKIADHDWLATRRAINPDGVDIGWVHVVIDGKEEPKITRYLWPQVLYKKTEGKIRLFRDTMMAAVELKKTQDGFATLVGEDDKPLIHRLQTQAEFRSRFPFGGTYHPNEAAAGALPAVILSEAPLQAAPKPNTPPNEKAKELARLREWFRVILR